MSQTPAQTAPAGSNAADRLTAIRKLIARAAADSGRKAEEVTLVAVSKTFTAAEILPVVEAGQRVFGENRVQEARDKWPALKQRFADIELHLIGPLQSNKSIEAVEFFEQIHSLDRPKLAASLAEAIQKVGRQPRLFIQVNTGAEPQKAGVLPQEADRFIDLCRQTHGLVIDGLMCIPPVGDPPSPHFAFLAKIAKKHGISQLSMGMSGDFAEAIQCGASHVRIGSAIFGQR